MPSRATGLMTPMDAYNIAPQQSEFLMQPVIAAISNKKAFKEAHQKYLWKQEEIEKEAIRKEEAARRSHERRLIEIGKQNEGRRGADLSSDPKALSLKLLPEVARAVRDQGYDLSSPEGQQAFQSIYQLMAKQLMGGEASAEVGPEAMGGANMPSPTGFSTGQAPAMGDNAQQIMPMTANDNRRWGTPGYPAYQGVNMGEGKPLDEQTAAKLLKKARGDKNKARALAKRLGYLVQ